MKSIPLLFVLLIASLLYSCGSKKTGVVTETTPLLSSENGIDTIAVIPTGTFLEYALSDSSRVKVVFKGKNGYVSSASFVPDGKPGVIRTTIEHFTSENNLDENSFVVVDSMKDDKAHIYYINTEDAAWIDMKNIDFDTTTVAVAAMLDALDSYIIDEETLTDLSKIAARHLDHPLILALNADLSEASDDQLKLMQKKYGVIFDRSQNKIISSKDKIKYWVGGYLNDALTKPSGGQEVDFITPRINYFYNYICSLPSFVKFSPKSIAFSWGAPADADSLKAYLLYRLDRKPENIKKLYDIYGDQIKDLLSSGYVQDVRPQMIALTKLYDQIVEKPNHRQLMSDISKEIAAWDRENTDDKGNSKSTYALIDQASIYEPVINTLDTESGWEGVWYSSFWVRRFAEGNEKVVYEILKDLSKVTPANHKDEDQDSEINETEIITCVFKDYSIGDCGHMEFDCGDYGDADTDGLSEEEQKLWNDLVISDTEGERGNPAYVGKSFSIRIGSTRGPACNEGQGGEGIVPKILEFKLLD